MLQRTFGSWKTKFSSTVAIFGSTSDLYFSYAFLDFSSSSAERTALDGLTKPLLRTAEGLTCLTEAVLRERAKEVRKDIFDDGKTEKRVEERCTPT